MEILQDGDFAACIGNLLQCLITLLVKSDFSLFLYIQFELTLFLCMITAFCSPLSISMKNLPLSSLLLPIGMGRLLLGPTKATSS